MNLKIYQVSTLQALAMGYSRSVVSVGDFLKHGDIGLGTFENVDGEMILLGGKCYRALEDGAVTEAEPDMGVPFAVTTFLQDGPSFSAEDVGDMESLKQMLDNKIEEGFGLNSMHIVKIDGEFSKIYARSEAPYRSQHVTLKEILQKTQNDYEFSDIKGTLVCVYFPDYMDGINAPGWHLHFVSDDRKSGGHVFDLKMKQGAAIINKISRVEIELPNTPAFDTYSLKDASQDEIKEVEQGKG
jgi:acetolactate decarboxylase